MNRKRNILIASAIGIVTLGLATGWNVLAAEGWPPQPYQSGSMAGTWTESDSIVPPGECIIVTISSEDPKTGKGVVVSTQVNTDVTSGGLIPGAASKTAAMGTYVRSGPNTWQWKLVSYVLNDAKPKPAVLAIIVVEGTATMTTPDAIEAVETASGYWAVQDKDLDGLPDPDEKPAVSFPITAHLRPL